MPFNLKAAGFLRGMANLLLGVDDTELPTQQLDAIRDILARHRLPETPESAEALLEYLKKKHLVDSITVARRNGSTLASSNGSNARETITGTALFNYIHSEIPSSEALLIKSREWFMVLPFKEKIYMVKAASDLSTVELRALAREIEKFFSARGQGF